MLPHPSSPHEDGIGDRTTLRRLINRRATLLACVAAIDMPRSAGG
jgi:hypothetical protein